MPAPTASKHPGNYSASRLRAQGLALTCQPSTPRLSRQLSPPSPPRAQAQPRARLTKPNQHCNQAGPHRKSTPATLSDGSSLVNVLAASQLENLWHCGWTFDRRCCRPCKYQ
ncbi:hypothetical protein HaLaN_13641 [Haematococcus lacustris]|uniref:Uncharacterized protein n=1 Tax=Haematococcus lacustris TaxID=44745 RepID=A0A699Z6E4_HAELA|nr:hypothetical protein HaLaN_13641 [Haematococcus lacustris]